MGRESHRWRGVPIRAVFEPAARCYSSIATSCIGTHDVHYGLPFLGSGTSSGGSVNCMIYFRGAGTSSGGW
jgi:hypothetical protein